MPPPKKRTYVHVSGANCELFQELLFLTLISHTLPISQTLLCTSVLIVRLYLYLPLHIPIPDKLT